MRFYLLIAIAAFFICGHYSAKAQYYNLMWEAGFKVGGANYLGEIGGVYEPQPFLADMRIEKTRPGLGVYGRRVITNWFSINAGLQYSVISAADSLSLDPGRFTRNLSFRNQIKEFYARGELYFLNWNDVGNTGRYYVGLRSYIFGGFTVFHHDPETYYNGAWHKLRPLKTEGTKYSAFQFGVPMGMGFTITVAKFHRFGIEGTWNYTFTDYLDDVSKVYLPRSAFSNDFAYDISDRADEVNPRDPKVTTSKMGADAVRGNPETNDSFFTVFLTYGYAFSGKSNFSRKRYDFAGKPRRMRKVKF